MNLKSVKSRDELDSVEIKTFREAARAKCYDCCVYDFNEVKHCQAFSCPLWAFRLGKKPKEFSRPRKPKRSSTERETSPNSPVLLYKMLYSAS